MSRRRYISTTISMDKLVNRLAREYGDFAALLYTWMIPHAEDDCTITGDLEELMMQVVPGRRDKTVEDVQAAIDGMLALGLLREVTGDDGSRLLQFPPKSFYRYQTYIPEEKRRAVLSASEQRKQRRTPKNAAERRASAQNTVSPSPSPSPTCTVPPPLPPPTEGGAPVPSDGQAPGDRDNTYSAEFEQFWHAYPRRVEKRRAWRCWRARLREGVSPEAMIAAAQNYARLKAGTEAEYLKHPATFLSKDRPFADWTDPSEAVLAVAGEARPRTESLPSYYDRAAPEPEVEITEEQRRRSSETIAEIRARLRPAAQGGSP